MLDDDFANISMCSCTTRHARPDLRCPLVMHPQGVNTSHHGVQTSGARRRWGSSAGLGPPIRQFLGRARTALRVRGTIR